MRLAVLFTMGLILPAFAQTGVQKVDGSNYTLIPLSPVPNGMPYRLVVMGDGFKASEQAAFNTAVDDIVADLRTRPPFSLNTCALDVYRMNVASKDSGIDHPSTSPTSPAITRDTYLNLRFGGSGEVQRCIRSDTPKKVRETAALVPGADFILVLANDAEYGGCYFDGIAFASMDATLRTVAHEFGHQMAGLADEYSCLICDGSDPNRVYAGAEPGEPNITTDARRSNPKWGAFVDPMTAIPTTTAVVGFHEGGHTFARGIYRSEDTCAMRDSRQPFCAVCSRALGGKLSFRCGDCAANPGGLPCFLSSIQKELEIKYPLPRWRFRWPVPPCLLNCSFISITDRFEYILAGVGRAATLRVLDASGRVLAAASAGRNGSIAVNWSGARSTEYWIDVDTGGPLQPTTLRSELKRNGVRQNLR